MKPGARLGDLTAHGGAALPGVGSRDVTMDGRPAWRALEDQCACAAPPGGHGTEVVLMGSTTVLINGRMAVRAGDVLQGQGAPNTFVPTGDETVLIGDVGFGMASAPKRAAFAASMRELLERWDELAAGEHIAQMQEIVNAAMPSGMPALKVSPKELEEGLYGEMNFDEWQLDINRDLLTGAMDEKKMGELANTLYHEGRHAEQWYNVAQCRAAEGQSTGRIHRETGVPPRVARAASRSTAPDGTSEGEMGKAVDASVYGSHSAHREQVFDDMDKHKSGAYDSYRALPEEKDAWAQGDAVEADFQASAY